MADPEHDCWYSQQTSKWINQSNRHRSAKKTLNQQPHQPWVRHHMSPTQALHRKNCDVKTSHVFLFFCCHKSTHKKVQQCCQHHSTVHLHSTPLELQTKSIKNMALLSSTHRQDNNTARDTRAVCTKNSRLVTTSRHKHFPGWSTWICHQTINHMSLASNLVGLETTLAVHISSNWSEPV